jgi:hypothetical protein
MPAYAEIGCLDEIYQVVYRHRIITGHCFRERVFNSLGKIVPRAEAFSSYVPDKGIWFGIRQLVKP